jgi:3-oxoadipate enol-lactonase
MIPISDTRRDAAWQKSHPEFYEQLVALGASDPYADEPGHVLGYARQLAARVGHDTYDRLDRIDCPVMIAAGRFDGIALPATQEKMAARIRGARLQFFDGGHAFMIQDRTAMPAMIAFLQG